MPKWRYKLRNGQNSPHGSQNLRKNLTNNHFTVELGRFATKKLSKQFFSKLFHVFCSKLQDV